jgi:hypothetical protein
MLNAGNSIVQGVLHNIVHGCQHVRFIGVNVNDKILITDF